jgi:hypothetical protein
MKKNKRSRFNLPRKEDKGSREESEEDEDEEEEDGEKMRKKREDERRKDKATYCFKGSKSQTVKEGN